MSNTQDWQNKSLQEVIEEFIEECIRYQYTQEKLIQLISISEPLKLKGINLAEKLAERLDEIEANTISTTRAEIYSLSNQFKARIDEQFNQLLKQLKQTEKDLNEKLDTRLERIEDKLDKIYDLIKKDEEALNWFCANTICITSYIVSSWVSELQKFAIEPDQKILVGFVLRDKENKLSKERIEAWDLTSGEKIYTIVLNGEYNYKLTISPDGKTFVNSSSQGIQQWDLSSGREICTLSEFSYAMAFTPDSKMLVYRQSIDKMYKFILYDLEKKMEHRTILPIEILNSALIAADFNGIVFSPDGQILALFDTLQDFIEILNIEIQEVIRVLEHSREIRNVVFSPSGRLLAILDGAGKIFLRDIINGDQIFSLASESDYYSAMAFCPDRRIFAAGCSKQIELWDLDSKKKLQTLTGHSDTISALCFDKNGKSLISYAVRSGEVKIWQSA
ncbi:WD40 repeat domain-containing protein [Scytonema millei]|uniref:Anaphase-promoting complex subunit 4-like WD40 domain-containing protein n=1 Tax=Scytonema millei VB511283 TaxID=1245923 RepID=A0A9X5E3G2_9CYAN|nr:hypothetical protein [Scytonema millei]NHC34313.1 hypothetical protein [Scytonema millei VB511283]